MNLRFDDAIATLTESGTYYLLVGGTSTSSTSYGFRLTDTAYVPLSFGTTINGTVTNAAQSDVFTFTGTAGERTYFQELSRVQRQLRRHLGSLRAEQPANHQQL